MSEKKGCLLCGAKLTYLNEPKQTTCVYCKNTFDTVVTCENNHYVCDDCHRMNGEEIILQTCMQSQRKDPFIIAEQIMKHPSIHMHGPEHHFLVPAVLLTSYYNSKKMYQKKWEKIKTAQKRAGKILGGFCGTHGVCGSAIGTGIFISIILQATPLSRKEWQLSNLITAESLTTIANHGGPRCCKRNTFLAFFSAIDFVKKHFKFSIPHSKDKTCLFSNINNECIEEKCPYYNK